MSRRLRRDDLDETVCPSVSSLLILIVCNMPSSQNASPSFLVERVSERRRSG